MAKLMWNWTLFGREIDIVFRTQKHRTREMLGLTNLTEDGRWIVFMDFDGFEQEWVEALMPHLQDLWTLSDAYLFKSSETGFHVVIFDKMQIGELVQLLRSASCDPNYVFVPLRYGKRLWTLRASEKNGTKPEFVKLIKSKFHHRTKSLAHIIAFEKLYKIKVVNRSRNDKLKSKLIVSGYDVP